MATDPRRGSPAGRGGTGAGGNGSNRGNRGRVDFTRARDLAIVAAVSTIAGYLLIRIGYQRIPPLPQPAGVAAAVLGAVEALIGYGLRSRIRARPDRDGRPTHPPVPPLTAARAVVTAKATSLAGAALAGLWLGVLLYVVPLADQVRAAGADRTAGLIGILGSLAMVGGALFLEHCLRTPTSTGGPIDGADRRR